VSKVTLQSKKKRNLKRLSTKAAFANNVRIVFRRADSIELQVPACTSPTSTEESSLPELIDLTVSTAAALFVTVCRIVSAGRRHGSRSTCPVVRAAQCRLLLTGAPKPACYSSGAAVVAVGYRAWMECPCMPSPSCLIVCRCAHMRAVADGKPYVDTT
jgi:hypothetical protein